MRAVTDDELVRVMLGNGKISASRQMLQEQKAAEKRECKMAKPQIERPCLGGRPVKDEAQHGTVLQERG